ncbi:hypothetical protein SAMN05444173_0651 [Opitutus sp. GAS368]|nr:hypothetical protein SAMN05444173_0651 [Opitutus sp. GAS368]
MQQLRPLFLLFHFKQTLEGKPVKTMPDHVSFHPETEYPKNT